MTKELLQQNIESQTNNIKDAIKDALKQFEI